ncbi:hypothetical protein AURDEDRAFT_126382 [Auricularia subglabra TFB-10046 SS5]|nr:hypothetical protein AURDEDRAFT_126382 [Auricularia subglabra TFB-10046 SS5]
MTRLPCHGRTKARRAEMQRAISSSLPPTTAMRNRHAAAPHRANVATEVDGQPSRPTAGRKRAAAADEGRQAKRQRVPMITTGGKSPRRQADTAAALMASWGDVADDDSREARAATPTATGAPQTLAAGFDAHAMPPHFEGAATLETTTFATPLNFDAVATPTTASFAMWHHFDAVATPGGTSFATPLNFEAPANSLPTFEGESFATPLNFDFPTGGTTTTLDRTLDINILEEQDDRVDPLLARADPQAAAGRPYVPPSFIGGARTDGGLGLPEPDVRKDARLPGGRGIALPAGWAMVAPGEPSGPDGTVLQGYYRPYGGDAHANDCAVLPESVGPRDLPSVTTQDDCAFPAGIYGVDEAAALDEVPVTRTVEFEIKVEEEQDVPLSDHAPPVPHTDDLHADESDDWVFQRPTALDEGAVTRTVKFETNGEEPLVDPCARLSAPLDPHAEDHDADDWVYQQQPILAMSPETQGQSAASPAAESPLAFKWLVLDGEDRVKAEEQDVDIPASPAAFPSACVENGLLTPEAEFEDGDWDDVTDAMVHHAFLAQNRG